ncbi:hypothetical protein AAFF_G00400720 [Aldrovandia affinis]|uniref:Uncharacterized protein n=1 Tax=Aldrovandia affinis TaxID=143900 RepID=A0AAD7WKC1_9TELE|nr:hypothetical protein AAFF_G00400720 [Aldrovandia affinis]
MYLPPPPSPGSRSVHSVPKKHFFLEEMENDRGPLGGGCPFNKVLRTRAVAGGEAEHKKPDIDGLNVARNLTQHSCIGGCSVLQ